MRFAPTKERFETSFLGEPNSGCWLWMGGLRPPGYGQIMKTGFPTSAFAHRVSWELYRGPIPDGMIVCHKCDTRSCVNPDHLFLGTNLDNTRDCISKGRHIANREMAQTSCYKGHPYGEDNLYVDRHGQRSCKICRRLASRAAGRRRRARNQ